MAESTRGKLATKHYLNGDGKTSAHASADAVAIMFKFADGEDVTVEPGQFSEIIARCFLLNGISQKLGDAYAGSDSPAEARESLLGLVEALSGPDGTWLQRGESAGPRVTLMAEAVSRVRADKYPTVADAEAMLKGKTKDERKAIVAIPEVAAAIAAIKAERATAAAAKAAAAVAPGTASGVEDL